MGVYFQDIPEEFQRYLHTVVRRELVLSRKANTQVHSFLQPSDNLYCQAGAEGDYTGTSSNAKVEA